MILYICFYFTKKMKTLVLSDIHKDLGARMVDFAGYLMPVQYEGVNIEHQSVREGVGIFDVSSFCLLIFSAIVDLVTIFDVF